MSTYAFESAERIDLLLRPGRRLALARLDLRTRRFDPIRPPSPSISQLRAGAGTGRVPRRLALRSDGARRARPRQRDDTGSSGARPSLGDEVRPLYLASREPIAFPTEGGETAHALYYPPFSPDFTAPAGEKAPVLVNSHGGPTASASSTLSLAVQYWTSRGIGVLDVNYRGSTGYGRAYRLRLERQWGIVDVEDCVHGARYLVEAEDADPERLMISGGSAGGYTTLCALTPAGEKTFSAGASYYGVSDLAALARDTHKFESRYLDWLIGPYPQERQTYAERSPINHLDRLAVPVIFFQGAEDKVVPPNQTELMVAGAEEPRNPGGLLPLRRRTAWLPQGREHKARPRRGTVFLRSPRPALGTSLLKQVSKW